MSIDTVWSCVASLSDSDITGLIELAGVVSSCSSSATARLNLH